jgi:hypothetical protein
VLTTQPGSETDSAYVTDQQFVFMSWAMANNGETPTASDFTIELKLDGETILGYLVDFPLDLETVLYDVAVGIGQLSAGSHEVQLVLDSTNAIDELDETNNTLTKMIGIAPSNDDRSRAITIGHGAQVAVTDTRFARLDAGDPQPSCRDGVDGHTVWYRYDATQDGVLTIDTAGSDFNTVLSVYVNGIGEITCHDDVSPTDTTSRVQVQVDEGRTYWIQVASFGSTAGGALILNTAFTAGRPNLTFVQRWSRERTRTVRC